MAKALIKAAIILPGTALVYIPAAILMFSRGSRFAPDIQHPAQVTFWMAIIFAAVGSSLAVKTVRLFVTKGEGTPAPWQPPRRLVIEGPYRYVRNPMILGVLLVLLGEAVFFNSWPLVAWAALFLCGNMIYFPTVEEPSLIRRFGAPYRAYLEQVPRLMPRLKGWDAPRNGDGRGSSCCPGIRM
jgi:protein-S-isoprenylcysteine O-methyltransferase Ste14